MSENYQNLPLASVLQRLGAGLIDGILRIILFILLFQYIEPEKGVVSGFLISFFLTIGYTFLQDTLPFLDGQSLRKKMLGIKVVDKITNESISGKYLNGIIRTIPRIIPFLSLVDIVALIADKDRIGDRWAKTKVVSLNKNSRI